MENNVYVEAIFNRMKTGAGIDEIYAEYENLLLQKVEESDTDYEDFEQLKYAVETFQGYLAAAYMKERGWVMNEHNSSPMWKRGEVE